ncbi:MAG: lectin-like protein [Verrucomicrobiota bacterium]|jgi:Lectin C-type domain
MKTTIALGSVVLLLLSLIQTRADIIAGPITNPANGHDYYLLSANTWTTSEAEAEVLGGTLAVIKNASEQNWVFSTFSNQCGLWIGLHRTRTGGPFAWVTGALTNYFNWGPGEPNNAGGHENCAHIQNGITNNSSVGTWNDLPDDGLLTGVVELPGSADHVSLSKPERALIGCWYEGGNAERPCWIAGTKNALFVISNDKFAVRAGLCSDGFLFVPDWQMDSRSFNIYYSTSISRPQTGMRGEIIKDKILWSNGTWWSRKPSNYMTTDISPEDIGNR